MSNQKKSLIDNYLQENRDPNQSQSLSDLDKYYGNASKNLQQNLAIDQANLQKNRAASVQRADIAYEKAKNYLPTMNKMNGLSGLGVSETASIDMYNRYANNRSAIDSSYNTAETELQRNYENAETDLFQNYLTARNNQLDREYERAWNEEQRAYERAETERLEKQQDQQREADYLQTILLEGSFSHFDDINNQINRAYWDGLISETDYNNLVQLAEAKRTGADMRDKPGNLYWYEDQGVKNPVVVKAQEDVYNDFNKRINNGHHSAESLEGLSTEIRNALKNDSISFIQAMNLLTVIDQRYAAMANGK